MGWTEINGSSRGCAMWMKGWRRASRADEIEKYFI